MDGLEIEESHLSLLAQSRGRRPPSSRAHETNWGGGGGARRTLEEEGNPRLALACY